MMRGIMNGSVVGFGMLTLGREGKRVPKSLVRVVLVWVVLLPMVGMSPLALMSPLAAQQDSIPGVTLGLLYEAEFQPALAVQPFSGRLGGELLASRVEAAEPSARATG